MTEIQEQDERRGSDPRLDSAQAGLHVIRGSAIRTTGYFLGLALGLVSVPLLTRHLGVVEFGRYVIVTSLIAIVAIVADAGLTTVGVREYAVRDSESRHRLMRNLVAMRLLIVAIGAVGAVLFALIAGYDGVLIAGTALGGAALMFTMVQQTYVIPLTAELRLGLATLLDLVRQALIAGGTVALVLVGASLMAFFVLPIPISIAILALTLAVAHEHSRVRPGADPSEWRYLLPETLPAAAASVLASLFYRVAIVMMSLIATATQTGYFAASFRVVEAFVAVPSLLVGSAFPLLARAADTDRLRLRYALQRSFEVCLILGTWIAVAVAAGAEPIINVIAGAAFAEAIPVLQIQGAAIAATFFVALFGTTLWVVREKRQLVLGNAVGVFCAIALTGALVPIAEAKGAALAMVGAEGVLAVWLGVALLWSRPELRPSLHVAPKVALAIGVAASLLLLPVHDVVAVALLSAVYFTLLVALRAIPPEIWHALRRPTSR